ncbi:uncharacterized protein LOC130046382 [Ostrea edulis]|uniref:uncharacterized protein LOC130046382 n=1 Tax=Ostrea edulis TaxID=37623 RepID=UPI0024AF029E|nr:uncharacterized protein LOC130046382 [Ostrea edulis]
MASGYQLVIREVYTGSALATCPPDLLAIYSSATLQNSDASTTCTGHSYDGCTHKLTFKFSYQACASSLAFSTSGDFYCLHYQTSGQTTYTITWNNDTVVTGSSTYRSTCYATRTVGSTLYVTEYPGFCEYPNQTSTYVMSPGIKYTLSSQTETCVTIKEGGSSGFYYFLIVLGILVIAAVVFIVLVMVVKYKNKIRMMELEVYTKESATRPNTSDGKTVGERSEQTPKLPPIFPNKPLVQSNEPEKPDEEESKPTTVEPLSPENTVQERNGDATSGGDE